MLKKYTFTSAIILAAGNSTRMDLPNNCDSKLFLKFKGEPFIFYTLLAFARCQVIDETIIVCKGEHVGLLRKIAKNAGIANVKIVLGGGSRQESVFNGVKGTSDFTDYLLIHDGARCLITSELIEKVLKDAVNLKSCSVLGVPLKDTIKKVSASGFVEFSLNRDFLWQIQTPQVIKKDLYCFCASRAIKENKVFTDDSQLVEHYLDEKVHVVLGDYNNIKLTTKDDVFVVEEILKSRSK